MTENEKKFTQAYFAWKLRYAENLEPSAESYGLTSQRAHQLAKAAERELEKERREQLARVSKTHRL